MVVHWDAAESVAIEHLRRDTSRLAVLQGCDSHDGALKAPMSCDR